MAGPNTNSMYHHTSQGSLSGKFNSKKKSLQIIDRLVLAAPQNSTLPPPPMPSYASPFLVDHGGHMISQPQPPPPPPPSAYMSKSKFDFNHSILFVFSLQIIK